MAQSKNKKSSFSWLVGVGVVLIAAPFVITGGKNFFKTSAVAEEQELISSVIIEKELGYIPSSAGLHTPATSEEEPEEKIVLPTVNVDLSNAPKDAKEFYVFADVVNGEAVVDKNLSNFAMQGNDNSFYLKHNAKGSYDECGSYMKDYRTGANDTENIVYIHHMSKAQNDKYKKFKLMVERQGDDYTATENLPMLYVYSRNGVVKTYAPCLVYQCNTKEISEDINPWTVGKTEQELETLLTAKATAQGQTFNHQEEGNEYITFSTCDKYTVSGINRRIYTYIRVQ